MRKAIGMLLILACSRSVAFSQTPEACRSAVQHLVLPSFVEARPSYLGQTLTPLKFLFSEQGIDVYSVGVPRPALVDGVRALLIYQDEKVRQKIIQLMRGPTPGILITGGIRRPLDHLKFAVVNFSCNESEFYAGKGVVNDIQYYEPKECIILPENTDIYEAQRLSMAGVLQRGDVINQMNWLTGLRAESYVPLDDARRFPDGRAFLRKIVQALIAERRDFDKR
jgi:hypothetical protein